MTTHPTDPPSTDRPPDDPRARLFGFVESGAIEEDLPTFAAAVDAYKAAVLRAAADRIDGTREPFPTAVRNGITWATAELRRVADEAEVTA